MKNLTLKSTVFSLMAIIMITAFLSSCEKEIIPLPSSNIEQIEIQSSVQNHIKKKGQITFKLPSDLEDADKKTIQRYLAKMNIEQITEKEESYRIENFLASIDRLDKVHKDLEHIDLLKQSDLKKYVTEQEFEDFSSFNVNSAIESRWCQTLSEGCFLGIKFRVELCCGWGWCHRKITTSWC